MPELPLELLAVCDDAHVLRSAATATQKLGGLLSSVPNAEVATEYIGHRRVDGVILDSAVEHAADLIRIIREGKLNRTAVIFACVNAGPQGNSVIAAGATFVFYKPLVPEALLQVLRAATAMMKDRRRYLRFEVTISVDIACGRTLHRAVTVNLSEAGMAVRSKETLLSGKSIGFSFELPDGPHIDGVGEVVWCSCTGVVGVRFQGLSGTGYRDLPEWLAEHSDLPVVPR